MTFDQLDQYEMDRDAIQTIYLRLRENVIRFGWPDTQEETWADAIAAWRRRKEANS